MSARLARFTAKHANANSAEIAISPYRHLSEQTASACFELPEAPCPDCGSRSFVLPPAGSWACAACHSPRGTFGWSFCSLPGSTLDQQPLDYPPGWRGWPDDQNGAVYLDTVLPDPGTALIARCSGCRFTAPLSPRKLCGACEVRRIEASAQRAANPDLASDLGEIMLRSQTI